LKLLLLTPYFQPAHTYGGPIVSIGHLCAALHQNHQGLTVLSTNADGGNDLPLATGQANLRYGYPVFYFKRRTWKPAFFAPALLLYLYRNAEKFDAIHIHTWWNLTAIPAVWICRIKGIRPVLSPRGMLSSYSFEHRKSGIKSIFHRLVGRFLLRRTILHATSSQEADECRQLIPDWPYFIAPNFIFFPPTPPIHEGPAPDAPFRLLFLSRIHEKKGLELLFQVLSNIDFPFECYVTGTGEKEYIDSLKILAAQLGIDTYLRWQSWAGEADKYHLLGHADLMVLPSYNENFANVVLESLSVGTPVLLSTGVGLSDYVLEHDFGWVVQREERALTEGLNQARKDGSKRARIRANAPSRIRKDFAPETVVQHYIAAYQSACRTH